MSGSVRIPADIEREDRVLANLTARQLAILAATGLVLYAGWLLTRAVLPIELYLVLAIPLGAVATVLALGQRDGLSLDRLMLAAVRQRLQPRHRVSAPEGIRPAPAWLTANTTGGTAPTRDTEISPAALRLPAEAISDTGVIDLGADGLAVVAVASTVNFALRTPDEQQALVATFGNYLHSLTAPIQILIRAQRLDLSGQIQDLLDAAPSLPHPRLEAAAREHATYLRQLGASTDLLRRQILLVLREPLHPAGVSTGAAVASPLAGLFSRRAHTASAEADDGARRGAEARLVRRLQEATELLSPTGIVVTPLDAGQATAVLASACNPDSLIPPGAGLAGASDVITLTPTSHDAALAEHASGPAPEHLFTHTRTNPAPRPAVPAPAAGPALVDEVDDWEGLE